MTKHHLKQPKVKEAAMPDYLNWLFFSKGFVITKNSLLLAFYELTPVGDYYNGNADEEALLCFNNFTMSLPDNTTIWYEWQKREPSSLMYPDQEAMFDLPLERMIEEDRNNYINGQLETYITRRLMTVSYTPSISKQGIMDESYEEFSKILIDMESRFSAAKIKTHRMNTDEICTYLHNIISTNRHEIKTPSAASSALSDALWDDDIDTTLIPLRLGNRYISIITIDDFPDTGTSTEMLNAITNKNGNIRWVTRFTARSPEEAKKIIDDRRRKYFSRRYGARDIVAHTVFKSDIELQDTTEINKSNECDLAMQDNGQICNFGYYTGFFVIEADTEAELKRLAEKIERVLSEHGFVYRDETINLFAAWLSSLPGNVEANPRRQFISTGNLSSVISLTAPYTGIPVNKHLLEETGTGLPHAVGILPNGALYNLNLNGASDVGHTFILGPTGAGKTVLLMFLTSCWGKYPGSRVIYFNKSDETGSTKPFFEGNGGRVYYPGRDTTTFQPLRDAQTHIERCMRFLTSIADVQKIELKAKDRKEMEDALKLLVPGTENLSIFSQLLEGYNHSSELVAALSSYTGSGAWGKLFDAEEDTLNPLSWPRLTAIEMGGLMDMGEEAIIPALTYITSQLDELFMDRKPTLLILDEAWVFFSHPSFRNFIIHWLKTLRKFNVFVIMATQEATDADALLSSILTNCHTKIMLANANAKTGPMANLYRQIGLTETDIDVISSKSMRPKRDYYIIQEEGNAVVDFAISQKQLEILENGVASGGMQ